MAPCFPLTEWQQSSTFSYRSHLMLGLRLHQLSVVNWAIAFLCQLKMLTSWWPVRRTMPRQTARTSTPTAASRSRGGRRRGRARRCARGAGRSAT